MSSGTGIHGYTGSSANGFYNISDGIIQSSAPSTNASSIYNTNNSASSLGSIASSAASQIASALNSSTSSAIAQGIAHTAGMDTSDYGEMIREILAESQRNTAMSQQFAREQMDYQTRSDATAMAWSAQEAEKNRAWQESLADTAHQREVRDLMAAGLNPLLSANAGAYTGSGATGQGFSSSGSMGTVDNSGTTALGSIYNTVMNTASQAQVAGIYANAEKYQADQQLAGARLSAETSILNNQNTTSAQKEIAAAQINGEIQRSLISSDATKYAANQNLAAAGTTAAATRYSADKHLAASQATADATKYASDNALQASYYASDTAQYNASMHESHEDSRTTKKTNSNWMSNPVGTGIQSGIDMWNLFTGLVQSTGVDFGMLNNGNQY